MIICCWKIALTNQDWTKASLTTKCLAEAYLEPCQTSKMERLGKVVNDWKSLFVKCSILDVWQGFELASREEKRGMFG